MAIAYLGLGSNLGNREEYLNTAITMINKLADTQVVKESSIIETAPYGKTDQPNFMNMCIAIDTKLSPMTLLESVLNIEHEIGRIREEVWGPRIIDIDILMYEDLELDLDQLNIPHEEMHLRTFVLEPLNEIAPKAVHPKMKKTVNALYNELKRK